MTIVSPDAGGAERARAYAKRLDAELAIIDKRRSEDGTAEVMNVIGDVKGRVCVIADDIIDTAGTIQKAAQALKDNGASRVLASAVHGVLSGPGDEAHREPRRSTSWSSRTRFRSTATRPRATRSWCSRWRACWRRRSAAFTKRRRSRSCLYRGSM